MGWEACHTGCVAKRAKGSMLNPAANKETNKLNETTSVRIAAM